MVRQWLHGIGQNLAANVIWLAPTLLVGIVTAAWGLITSYNGPVIFVLSLQAIAALLFAIGSAVWINYQRKVNRTRSPQSDTNSEPNDGSPNWCTALVEADRYDLAQCVLI